MKKTIAVLLFVIVIASGFGKCGKESAEDRLRKQAAVVLPSPLPVQWNYLSPSKALVAGNIELTNEDRDNFLADVDTGIQRTLKNSSCLGYANWRTIEQFTVVYERPTSYSLDGHCPTLNLKTGQKIAGIVIGVGDLILDPPFIYIAYEYPVTEQCREFRRSAIQNEAEHIEAWFNDQQLFWTKTGLNDIHPFYQDRCNNSNNENLVIPPTGKGSLSWENERNAIIERLEKVH